jgi:F-type H+-transporting ATPase subunit b
MIPALIAAEGEDINPLIPQFYDIFWSAVLFAIFLALFIWLVVPRLNTLLDERADKIEGGLQRAEEAQAAAAATKGEYEQALADARAEAAQIREKARADAGQIRTEILEEAQREAARVKEQAQAAIEAERTAAQQSLRVEVGSLALDLASRVIGETLSDDTKATAMVDRFLSELDTIEKASK